MRDPADLKQVETAANALDPDPQADQLLDVRFEFKPPPAAIVFLENEAAALPQQEALFDVE